MGTVDVVSNAQFTELERELSEQMVTAWSDFAKAWLASAHVDSSTSEAPFVWPAYNASGISTQWGAAGNVKGPSFVSGYHYSICDFWDEIGYQEQ